jgi:hypothetical protein
MRNRIIGAVGRRAGDKPDSGFMEPL